MKLFVCGNFFNLPKEHIRLNIHWLPRAPGSHLTTLCWLPWVEIRHGAVLHFYRTTLTPPSPRRHSLKFLEFLASSIPTSDITKYPSSLSHVRETQATKNVHYRVEYGLGIFQSFYSQSGAVRWRHDRLGSCEPSVLGGFQGEGRSHQPTNSKVHIDDQNPCRNLSTFHIWQKIQGLMGWNLIQFAASK